VIQWKRHGVFLNVNFWVQLTKFHPSGRFALKKKYCPLDDWRSLHLIHERDQICYKLKKTKNHSLYDRYIFLRNQIQIKKVQAKTDFLSDKLHVYKNNLKNCGKLLKVSARHHKVTLSQAH